MTGSQINLYLPLWTAALSAQIVLTCKIKEKWTLRINDFVNDIDSFNAERGFDLAVSPEVLARDLLVPLRTANLKNYAERQGIDSTEYRKELKSEVPRPYFLLLFLLIQVAVLIGTVGGLIGILHLGSWFPTYFFGVVYGMLVVNLLLYLFL